MSYETDFVKPNNNESYKEYVDRLLLDGRFLRKNNRPKNIYTEGHHILPKSQGGSDKKENIIIIFPEEHYFCHKLLAQENPEESTLQFAWWNMCHKMDSDAKRLYDVPPEEYAEAKRRTSSISSKMNSIPVVEFVSGVIYPSAEEAARQLNIGKACNITSCCRGKSKSANGYKFCYLSDYLTGNYKNQTVGKRKRIIDVDTKKVYESSVDAANELNLSKVNIREVCRGIRKSVGGHRFVYYEDYLSGNYVVRKIGHEGKKVKDIDTGIIYESGAEAGRQLNLDASSILKVCNNKIQSTKGHHFIFCEDDN